MIGRLVWFAAGAGAAVWTAGKVRSTLRRATPEAIGQRVTGSLAGIGGSARDLIDQVRAAMAEREAELRALLDERGADSRRLGLTEQPTRSLDHP